MRTTIARVACVVLIGASGATTFAQAPVQVPLPSQVQQPSPPRGSTVATSQTQVIVTGCVQREGDYRRVQNGVRANVTVITTGNEFVLINTAAAVVGSSVAGTVSRAPRDPAAASAPVPAPAVAPAAGPASASAPEPQNAVVTPAATTGIAYQLTGAGEGQMGQYVGRWVEISGTLKDPQPTAGGRSSQPPPSSPGATDVTTLDLNLRQLEIDSVRALSGACAAQ